MAEFTGDKATAGRFCTVEMPLFLEGVSLDGDEDEEA